MAKLFYKILDRIKRERFFEKGDKIILACSGGPDSVALLDILARVKRLFNLKIIVAYFNHGLRPYESKREKNFVENLSHRYGLHFVSGKGDVSAFARKNKISVQEAARSLRYNFFFDIGRKLNIHKIVLGHHRDDIIETILLGILKGGGLKTFSGIEAKRERDRFLIIRPMCEVTKDEITSYLSGKGLVPCLDSSNLKKTYLRNRLRLKILPILRKDINPKVDKAILRLGEIYSRENEYLDEVVSKKIDKIIKQKGKRIYIDRKFFLKQHTAIKRRLLREVFGCLGIIGEGSNFCQIEILKNFISTFHPGQTLDLAGGFIARGAGGKVYIGKKSTGSTSSLRGIEAASNAWRRPTQQSDRGIKSLHPLHIPGETLVKDLDIKITARFSKRVPSLKEMKSSFPEKVFLDAEKIKLPLYIRAKEPGDSFKPLGMSGTIKLKKYFINAGIPRDMRGYIPIVVMGNEIIWITGYAISEKVKVTPRTRDVLILRKNHLP